MVRALSQTCQARKNITAAHSKCTARTTTAVARGVSTRSMKSMVTCSSACDTSGRPAKISTSSISSVTSKPPRNGKLNRYRATTSTKVSSIMANRMAEAATPSTASIRLSQMVAGWLTLVPLFAGSDLLQLLAEFGQHIGAVDALGVGRLDPLVVERLRLRHHFLDEGGLGGIDLRARRLQARQAKLVGAVPGLAVAARRDL